MSHSDSETPSGMPHWVKVLGIVVIILFVKLVVLLLTDIGVDLDLGMLTGVALLALLAFHLVMLVIVGMLTGGHSPFNNTPSEGDR